MTRLAGAVTMAVVDEFGPAEMLARLSDPWWFQAFGCVLGFDWHSSGVTTVTCGALKEAYKHFGSDLGIIVAGGKGAASRKTPLEIEQAADRFGVHAGDRLVYASRMSAKIDSAAVQDGFDLYHHCFLFTRDGQWSVIQQGMNGEQKSARRYHWLGEHVHDFVCEPHVAVHDLDARPATVRQLTLNMTAGEAAANRKGSAALVLEKPDWLLGQIERYTEGPTLFAPKNHAVLPKYVNSRRLRAILVHAHERHPRSFEELVGTSGVGPATILSLSLLAELIFEAPASRRDPGAPPRSSERQRAERQWADYSYAHGGKDGTPFPVDRQTYDRNIDVLVDAVRKARIGQNDKMNALRRLAATG
jgi:hypothetical protein